MELTKEKLTLIERRRAEDNLLMKQNRFYSEVIKMAALFRQWSVKEGDGLTFSTFVNQFGAADLLSTEFKDHLYSIYDAVLDTLNTAAKYADRLREVQT